jgi:hypothetical protein
MTPTQKKWLATALATRPGQKHKDLGKYKRQTFGCATNISEGCRICGKYPTRKGHDPCLANLPGVYNACCGHGAWPPYATLTNGFCLVGKALEIYLEKVARMKRFREMHHKPQACAECGISFHPKRTDARYCSAACKQRAYRNR